MRQVGDQAAKRDLQLDRIHTILNTNTFREQTKMKEQMARHYNEQAFYGTFLFLSQIREHNKLIHWMIVIYIYIRISIFNYNNSSS